MAKDHKAIRLNEHDNVCAYLISAITAFRKALSVMESLM